MNTPTGQTPKLRSSINTITSLTFIAFCLRLWTSVDPQPEPMTLAVQQASEARMSAYFVCAGVLLFGLFALLRYLVGAIVNGLAAQTGGLAAWLCIGTAALLAAAVFTPYTAPLLGGSVLAALAANWAVEEVLLRRSIG